MTGHPARRALIADDEPGMLLVLRAHLRRRGWEAVEVSDGLQALERVRADRFDAVILDQRMPGLTGIEVAREMDRDVPIFLFSAYLEPAVETELAELGCIPVTKGSVDVLLDHLERLTEAT